MIISVNANRHTNRGSSALLKKLNWLALVLLMSSLAPALQAAPACNLPDLSADLPGLTPTGKGSNIPGIVRDKPSASLTSRIYSERSAITTIPGGQFSGATPDGLRFNYNKNHTFSQTAGASAAAKKLISDLKRDVGLDVVAAHLVHHFFEGNRGGNNNFTVTTGRTNGHMRDHGEEVAIEGMRKIYNNFYKGKNYQDKFVGSAAGTYNGNNVTLYFKPGVEYYTQNYTTQSVFDYDTNEGRPDFQLMPNLYSSAFRDKGKKMYARLETKVRYIIHEYAEVVTTTARGTRTTYEPTGNWYYMPADMFDELRGDIFHTTYGTQNNLPTSGNGTVNLTPSDVEINVTGGGRDLSFIYFNQE